MPPTSTTPTLATNSLSPPCARDPPDGSKWTRDAANEFGCLFQGIGTRRQASDRIKGTTTCFFIARPQVPPDRKVTYANFICNVCPQKKETHRIRCTVGGDKLDYPGDASSPTVYILDTKVHLNSIISDARKGARYLCMDISNYYLGTPMKYYQYMRINQPPSPFVLTTLASNI